MKLNALRIILIFIVPCAFGALTEAKHCNVSDAVPSESEEDTSPPIFKLPPEVIVKVADFLDYPFLALPSVCKHFKDLMAYTKTALKIIFKDKIDSLIFKEIGWSVELHRLIRINPTILNRFLDDFVVSNHCFKVMNCDILRYSIEKIFERNSANLDDIKCFIEALFRKLIDERKYDCIEQLIILVFEMDNLRFGFQGREEVRMELIKRFYAKNKRLIEFLIRQSCFRENIIIDLFNTQTSVEDLHYFRRLDDFSYDIWTIESMKSAMLEPRLEFTSEEKEQFLARNQEILESIPSRTQYDKYIFSLTEACNIVRYSKFVDNAAIVGKYFSENSIFYSCDRRCKSVTEDVAIIALLAGNVDLFFKMHQIRNGTKFSVKFYKLLSSSQKLMDLLPDEALLTFFDIPSFDLTLRLEVIARKDANSRSLEDLNRMFLNQDLFKLTAMALFYPIHYFLDSLNLDLIHLIIESCLSYSSKVRNILNNPVQIVHEILQSPSDLSTENITRVNYYIFGNLKFIKMLVDPESADMLNVMISYFEYFPVSDLFEVLQNDFKFRKDLASPRATELRLKLKFDLKDLLKLNLLAHEIVQLLRVLGLEIGDFGFDSLEAEPETTMADLISDPYDTVETFMQVGLDKLLVNIAINDFTEQYFAMLIAINDPNEQNRDFEEKFNSNPMDFHSFGVFQLWRERNFKTFKRFAPKEFFDVFEQRISGKTKVYNWANRYSTKTINY